MSLPTLPRNLPPFNPIRPCAKCGDRNASTRYLRQADALRRDCASCGYDWQEAPLDAR